MVHVADKINMKCYVLYTSHAYKLMRQFELQILITKNLTCINPAPVRGVAGCIVNQHEKQDNSKLHRSRRREMMHNLEVEVQARIYVKRSEERRSTVLSQDGKTFKAVVV